LATDIVAKPNLIKKNNARPIVEGIGFLICGLDTLSDSRNNKT
jgi:hypothetical protein